MFLWVQTKNSIKCLNFTFHIHEIHQLNSTLFDWSILLLLPLSAPSSCPFLACMWKWCTEILLQHNIKFNLINDCEMDQTHKIDHITEITRAAGTFFPGHFMALNCNASQHHHPDEMWYFKLASDVFNGNIIVVCAVRLCFLFLPLFQLVSKFYATHKIHWLNVDYYVRIRRIAVFTEDAAAFLCCCFCFFLVEATNFN